MNFILDSGYFSADSYDHMTLIAWIPFMDTHENNGGMQVLCKGYKTESPLVQL